MVAVRSARPDRRPGRNPLPAGHDRQSAARRPVRRAHDLQPVAVALQPRGEPAQLRVHQQQRHVRRQLAVLTAIEEAKMASFAIDGLSITRAALLATSALVLSAGVASARVGVTSATDGDPLGKPPSDAERVLRIGIDVQANELITTRANDRAHLVFLDGTSLTVGPNAQLTIDRFVFDPNTKTGELAINASKGVLRLVGGKISKTQPITITTPASTIGIRGGITILTVEPNKTTSTFVFGKGMTVSAAGQTQTVTRQGTQVTTNTGTPPGQPTVVPAGGYSSELSQLEGGGGSSSSSGGSGGSGGGGQQAATGGTTGGAAAAGGAMGGGADQKAQASGFSGQNSSQTPAAVQPPTVNITAGSPAQNVANANIVSNVLSNAATDQQQQQAVQLQQQQSQTTQTAQTTPTPTATPTPTPTPTPVTPPPTTVIVTRGRFSQEPAYTNFNNQTLGATPVAANNRALMPTGTLTNGLATMTLDDGRSFTVPWQPGGSPYTISLVHPTLGPLNGTGYVTPTGDFFAFVFTDSSSKKLGFAGGTPTTLAQFPTSGFATHVLTTLRNTGALPWAPPTVANDSALKAAANASPLYSVYSPNSNPVIGGPALSSQGADATQTTVAIAGVGAAQKSYVGTFIGDYFKDFNTNSTFNSGAYYGTYRLASGETISRAVSAGSTFDTGGAHSVFGPNAETMLYSASSYRSTTTTSGGTITSGTTTATYQASLDQPHNNLAGVDYRQNTLATKVDNPAALNASRTSQNFTGGYVGGIVEQTTSGGAQSTRTIGVDGAFPAQVFMQTDAAANRVFATITVSQWNGPNTSSTFNLGGTSGPRFSTQTFINDQIYALRDRPTDSFSTQVASVTINGNTSTGTDIAARTNMVSYGAAPVANFFAEQGVTPCACEFMTWGWWSGEVRYGNNSVYNPNGRDRLHLASYVAGNITPTLQMPTTGTATFTGHAIGNVHNGANAYVAAGSFTKVWNFAAQSGNVTIGNFDGATYTGAATQLTGPGVPASQYNGTIAGGGRTGNLTGSFFDAGAVRAKGTGGSFNINGPGYKAGGIFAGQRP
ncbi:MAG: hypothetical protein GEV13_17285 [Rhodospirillales bacterium]|nr:hypothetical protein [Rhodospirillales bacterium]